LLIVGGNKSGCAAAVQAARLGVPRIVLVNDIEWLDGLFGCSKNIGYSSVVSSAVRLHGHMMHGASRRHRRVVVPAGRDTAARPRARLGEGARVADATRAQRRRAGRAAMAVP